MSPLRWAVLGLGLALATVFGMWQVQVANLRGAHAVAISAEQKRTRDTQGAWDAYKLEVEQTIGNNARQQATELQAALDERDALAADVERLRQQYAARSKELADASKQLLRILNDAPKDQDSLLDARTRAYYRSLRERQTAAAPASDTPPR